MTLKDALQESLRSVPDGIAVGYLDLSTGSLLSQTGAEDKPQEFLNVMASAVTELFEAPLFKVLDKIWADDVSEDDFNNEAFTEILLFGQNYTTLLKRCSKNVQHAVFYVTKSETPPGVLLMQVRSGLPRVEDAV